MTIHEKLIAEIFEFLKRTGMSKTEFGVSTVRDGKLVPDLENGRSIQMKTYERIMEFMRSYDKE